MDKIHNNTFGKKENRTIAEKILKLYGRKFNLANLKTIGERINQEIKNKEYKKYKIESRTDYNKTNFMFELNRRAFYRKMEENNNSKYLINKDPVKEFWSKMWENDETKDYSILIDTLENIEKENVVEEKIEKEYVFNIIKKISNWKSPGNDCIYNFFIKYLSSLHSNIYEIIIKIIENPKLMNIEFLTSRTLLMPKCKNPEPGEFRPISCLSNLYKLITKIITEKISTKLRENNFISINQLGTVKNCQGAKEQSLINLAIKKEYEGNLNTFWIDISKAFDSVNHNYLKDVIKKLPIDKKYKNFIMYAIENWQIKLELFNETLIEKKVKKGLLQGDSLSPLLFVVCLEPISRIMQKEEGINVYDNNGNKIAELNHLVFIDDIKILSKVKRTSEKILKICIESMNLIGLELNEDKSAASFRNERKIKMVNNDNFYKYLGVLENKNKEDENNVRKNLEKEILRRTELLCKQNLNAKNFSMAINEYTGSLLNYYIGIIDFPIGYIEKLDKKVRIIFKKYAVIYKNSCTERIYLPRKEMGRGFTNFEDRKDILLYKIIQYFKSNETTRKKIINRIYASQFEEYEKNIRTKHKVEEDIKDKIDIKRIINEAKINKIKEKDLHGKIYRITQDEKIDTKISNDWINEGVTNFKEEAKLTSLQDRNYFTINHIRCQCGRSTQNIEHRATRCGTMINTIYKKRHAEILKSIQLSLLRKYKILTNKKISKHQVTPINEKDNIKILVEPNYITEKIIKYNRPDIIVINKKENYGLIIEIGVTSYENLIKVETQKRIKYLELAQEMEKIENIKFQIIPYIITWDGFRTKYNAYYSRKIGISKRTSAYIAKTAIYWSGKTIENTIVAKEMMDTGVLKEKNEKNNIIKNKHYRTEMKTEEEENTSKGKGEKKRKGNKLKSEQVSIKNILNNEFEKIKTKKIEDYKKEENNNDAGKVVIENEKLNLKTEMKREERNFMRDLVEDKEIKKDIKQINIIMNNDEWNQKNEIKKNKFFSNTQILRRNILISNKLANGKVKIEKENLKIKKIEECQLDKKDNVSENSKEREKKIIKSKMSKNNESKNQRKSKDINEIIKDFKNGKIIGISNIKIIEKEEVKIKKNKKNIIPEFIKRKKTGQIKQKGNKNNNLENNRYFKLKLEHKKTTIQEEKTNEAVEKKQTQEKTIQKGKIEKEEKGEKKINSEIFKIKNVKSSKKNVRIIRSENKKKKEEVVGYLRFEEKLLSEDNFENPIDEVLRKCI